MAVAAGLLALALAGCVDYVFDQAPSGCGFPRDAALDFAGLATPLDLGVASPLIDPTVRVEAYVTQGRVDIFDRPPSRAMCLVVPDGDDVAFLVRPVSDDWDYPGR